VRVRRRAERARHRRRAKARAAKWLTCCPGPCQHERKKTCALRCWADRRRATGVGRMARRDGCRHLRTIRMLGQHTFYKSVGHWRTGNVGDSPMPDSWSCTGQTRITLAASAARITGAGGEHPGRSPGCVGHSSGNSRGVDAASADRSHESASSPDAPVYRDLPASVVDDYLGDYAVAAWAGGARRTEADSPWNDPCVPLRSQAVRASAGRR
jgi:hypothetical protein